MNRHFIKQLTLVAAIAVSAVLALAHASDAAAQIPAPTLTTPDSPDKALDADGFIRRWLVLEPLAADGLTDSAVQSAVRKEYFPGQLTVVPGDGDKVNVGGAEL